MNPFEAISYAQRKLLRSSAWQMLLIAVCQLAISVVQDLPVTWIYLSLALALVSLPPLISEGNQRGLAFGFVVPLILFSLAAPWELGGARQPMTILPIVVMQSGAFLLGVPFALWIGGASILNVAALAICESKGIIESSGPSIETLLLFVTVFSVHCLLFISIPLDVIRQLLTHAAADLSARRENETKLLDLTDDLENSVEARRQELTQSRARLHQSVDEISASVGATITDLLVASRELAESFPADAGEARWSAFRITSGCERMETMHASFHRFCKLGEGALSLRPLSPEGHTGIVHRIWSEVRSLQPDRTISFFLDPIPGCICDADLLRQVWQNLLSNAAKYTAQSPAPCVRVYFRDGEFCVEDNGAGFDMAWADKLFAVFQRSHGEGEYAGSGIGLAMVRRIIEMHNGSIRAEGRVGQGATFRFRLPQEPALVNLFGSDSPTAACSNSWRGTSGAKPAS